MVIVKKMLELGVKQFSFTPHISFPSPMNTPEIILEKLNELKERLLKEGIEIEADAGAEYKIGEYMIDLIRQGNIASFHGGKVLVEHSFVAPSPVFEEVIFRLQDKGYTPVLAHPERYPFYMKHLTERVWELKRRSTVSSQLDTLEKKGLIQRVPVSHDARLKKLVLTEEGLRISGQVLLVLEQMNDFMIQGLSQEETVVLTNLLRKIEQNLSRIG